MNTCGICQQTADTTQIELDEMNMTLEVCPQCAARGPESCAQSVLEQADTAVLLGLGLLRINPWDWPWKPPA